jgi:aminocarboxymuconate-semialdehyde decarboxylase
MIIDAHSHVAPRELIDAIRETGAGAEVEDLLSRPYLYDWDARVRYMDAHGIDMQVLVLARPPMWLGLERTALHELTRLANDALAAAAATHPDRFVAVGVLPVVDEVMLGELERLQGLGLRGVQIYSNIEGRAIDSEEMWPFFEAAAAADLPIWIHPQHGPSHDWMEQDLVNRLFYWPFETTAAMARIVFGGVFDRFPNLQVVTHHMGGMTAFYASRIDSFHSMAADFAKTGLTSVSKDLGGDVAARFKNFYADTAVSGSDSALRLGLEFYGADRLVFGTDFPFEGERIPVEILESVRRADISEADRAKILGGNAARMLKLEL